MKVINHKRAQRFGFFKNIKFIGGVAIGLALGGSAVAMAAIPDASGVIHACYTTSGQGKFRRNYPLTPCNPCHTIEV